MRAKHSFVVQSSAFKVRDLERFLRFCKRFGFKVATKQQGNPAETYVSFSGGPNSTGIPVIDPATGRYIDFLQELSRHLIYGQIAEVREVGTQGRCLVGYCAVVASDGTVIDISLDEVYDKVESAWKIRLTSIHLPIDGGDTQCVM